jgi:hypothetical protein
LIIHDIPARAFIEDEEVVSGVELNAFSRYFDLRNEQLFLAERGRVGENTIADWKQGISDNVRLPMFAAAWKSLRDGLAPDYWEHLRPVADKAVG